MTAYQSVIEGKYSDVSSVMYVVPSHYRICVIFHPNTGESISTDFVVLVYSLSKIRYVQANVFAVAYVAMFYDWIGSDSVHANRCSNCNKTIQTTLFPRDFKSESFFNGKFNSTHQLMYFE